MVAVPLVVVVFHIFVADQVERLQEFRRVRRNVDCGEIRKRFLTQESLQIVVVLPGEGFDRPTVLDVIRRVDANEYKRMQAPPGIKVTSRAFGTGRRMPIAARRRADGPSTD